MNACKTCLYWSAASWRKNKGLCLHAAIGGKYPPCKRGACAVTGEYQAIVTGPDFGCIHWTAKPLPEAPQ